MSIREEILVVGDNTMLDNSKRTKRLTDNYFKSWHRQRIHRAIKAITYFLNDSKFFLWLSYILGSFCGAAFVLPFSYYLSALTLLSIPMYHTYGVFFWQADAEDVGPPLLFLLGLFGCFLALPIIISLVLVIPFLSFISMVMLMNVCFGSLFYFLPPYLLATIANILYSPSPKQREVILIDPDGNPEMCKKIGQYPALEGFYGYRLPNVGDLEKIERYMRNY